MTEFANTLFRLRGSTEEPHVYAEILRSIVAHLPAIDREAILRCDSDAEWLHDGQLRNDGAPYIVHPRRVAILTASYTAEGFAPDDIQVALAHDLIEDCGITEEWLSENYGARVAAAVKSLSAPAVKGETKNQRRDRKKAKYSALAKVDKSVLRLHAMDVLDNTISWRFIQPETEGWRKIPRWMWQVTKYQIPLLSGSFGDIADELAKEIDYERHRGFEIGSWESP